MDRRRFLLISLGGTLAAPLAPGAQPQGKLAFLCPANCPNLPNLLGPRDKGFLAGLEQVGYVLSRNASVDLSGTGVGYDRLPDAAKKLVQRKVDVIIAVGNEATGAAREATKNTPIVMLNVADAVE